MFRSVIVSVLLLSPLVLAGGEQGPPKGWKAYSGGYKKEAYVVWLPAVGKLDESESQIVSPKFGQIRVFRTVCQRKDGSMFGAGQINLPPQLVKQPPKVRQNFFRDLFLDEVNGTLVEEKNVKLDTMTGKEYVIRTPSGMARYRVFGAGVQVFRVFVVGSKKQVEGKEADILFTSFKRTRPGTVTADPKTGPDTAKTEAAAPGKGFTKPGKAAKATSYLKIVSSAGDYIGQGKTYEYKGDELTLSKSARGVNVRVDGWTLDVAAPGGQSLKPGDYQGAKRFPFNGASPGLSFSGKGRGSNTLSGEFVVWELEIDAGKITRLAIDFVQRTGGAKASLTGKLRFNSKFE